jgi:hypothetical protein
MVKYLPDSACVLLACLIPLVLTICLIDHVETRSQEPTLETWSHSIEDSTGLIYVPDERHFRARYDIDADNQALQSWDEYWEWVKVFYSGNLLARGWIIECRKIVDRINDLDQKDRAIQKMNVLGRLIAAEWARDNSVRLIDTGDIRQWLLWLREASIGNEIEIVVDTGPLFESLNRIESLVVEKIKKAGVLSDRTPAAHSPISSEPAPHGYFVFRVSSSDG